MENIPLPGDHFLLHADLEPDCHDDQEQQQREGGYHHHHDHFYYPPPIAPNSGSSSSPYHPRLEEEQQGLSAAAAATTTISSSFASIKLKTLQSLYGIQLVKKNKHNKQQHDLRKNNDGVYYSYNLSLLRDKSPKGSVDEAIRSLVDLLNAHPCFATLSSCSGRITLFDPNASSSSCCYQDMAQDEETEMNIGRSAQMNDDDHANNNDHVLANEQSARQEKSGKGYGTWLLSCHDTITTVQLHNALQKHRENQEDDETKRPSAQNEQHTSSSSCLLFMHEPLLLHVAASNLSRAQQLLKIAFDLGFRESGIMASSKKFTVAIRTHSLSLVVPLSSSGSLAPNREFLDALVNQANQRMVVNQEKLKRLEEKVRQTLFRPKKKVREGQALSFGEDDGTVGATLECTWSKDGDVPPLGLWGHTAVAISGLVASTDDHSDDSTKNAPSKNTNMVKQTAVLDILVMGGYGVGPYNVQNSKSSSRRSDKVYCLRRYGNNVDPWDECWRECFMNTHSVSSTEWVNVGGFVAKPVSYSAREASASCIMPESIQRQTSFPLIIIFGGRESPARPKDELFLMTYDANSMEVTMFTPSDVRGDKPEPRWGHTLTALSGKGGRVALLAGGRNEKEALSSVYVLSCRTKQREHQQRGLLDEESQQQNGMGELYFVWERISESLPPRFYHGASRILVGEQSVQQDNIEQIVIHGGLSTTALIPRKENDDSVDTMVLVLNPGKDKTDCNVHNVQVANNIVTFGGAMCSITKFHQTLLLCSGGVVTSHRRTDANVEDTEDDIFKQSVLQAMIACDNHTPKDHQNIISPYNIQALPIIHKFSSPSQDEKINIGSLVHHCCVELPSHTLEELDMTHPQTQDPQQHNQVAEIALIGGGVPMFAFGPSFAKSYHITMRLCSNPQDKGIRLGPQMSMVTKKQSFTNTIASSIVSQSTTRTHNALQRETCVIFVHKSHAKQVKTALEQHSWLDRNYRMVKVGADGTDRCGLDNATDHIAVPVTKECWNILTSAKDRQYPLHDGEYSWLAYIVKSGTYVVPFSSVVLGRK